LLQEANIEAKEKGVYTMSPIVASENGVTKRLFIKLGYNLVSSLPVVDHPNSMHGGNWELLNRQL
jgi:L-amino acid N-acyltransferase YncA